MAQSDKEELSEGESAKKPSCDDTSINKVGSSAPTIDSIENLSELEKKIAEARATLETL